MISGKGPINTFSRELLKCISINTVIFYGLSYWKIPLVYIIKIIIIIILIILNGCHHCYIALLYVNIHKYSIQLRVPDVSCLQLSLVFSTVCFFCKTFPTPYYFKIQRMKTNCYSFLFHYCHCAKRKYPPFVVIIFSFFMA